MIDPQIFEISQRLTIASLEERWGPLEDSIAESIYDLTDQGMGHSSVAVGTVAHICATEARAAVQLAWQNIWRVALNIGVEPSEDLAPQLKAAIRSQTEEHFRRLIETVELRQRGVSYPELHTQLRKARDLMLAQVEAEVDLAVASLKRKTEREGVPSVFQFYAPVGAVLSGANASASVVQHLGAQQKSELTTALERLADAIERADEFRDQAKDDVMELVQEARGEVDRARPNRLHLASVLLGIGQAVQTAGSVAPAYGLLKSAAALIGVQLPQ